MEIARPAKIARSSRSKLINRTCICLPPPLLFVDLSRGRSTAYTRVAFGRAFAALSIRWCRSTEFGPPFAHYGHVDFDLAFQLISDSWRRRLPRPVPCARAAARIDGFAPILTERGLLPTQTASSKYNMIVHDFRIVCSRRLAAFLRCRRRGPENPELPKLRSEARLRDSFSSIVIDK